MRAVFKIQEENVMTYCRFEELLLEMPLRKEIVCSKCEMHGKKLC
jgi:hypothetical protein